MRKSRATRTGRCRVISRQVVHLLRVLPRDATRIRQGYGRRSGARCTSLVMSPISGGDRCSLYGMGFVGLVGEALPRVSRFRALGPRCGWALGSLRAACWYSQTTHERSIGPRLSSQSSTLHTHAMATLEMATDALGPRVRLRRARAPTASATPVVWLASVWVCAGGWPLHVQAQGPWRVGASGALRS